MNNKLTPPLLECADCGYQEPLQQPPEHCPVCGGDWLDVVYDYEKVARAWPAALCDRFFDMWRYQELLPLRDNTHRVTMGEGGTPLLRAVNLGMMLSCPHIYVKDERQGPTGSFKDRQASLSISVMKELGLTEGVVASTGNVAIAYSAYSSLAGVKLWAFLTSRVPQEKMREVAIYGSEVIKVTATYDATKKVAARFATHKGITPDRGIRNIGTRESMKLLAFEVAEQLTAQLGPPQPGIPWRAPDWYIQAVSGGMGPVGFWKGYDELYRMGLVDRRPKLALIQASGCAPMVNSFRKNLPEAETVANPQTQVITIATGSPGPAYSYLYNVVDEHGGTFEDVSDEETYRALHVLAKMEGLSMESAAAAAFAGLFKLLSSGVIKKDETIVVNCSGHTFPVEKFLLEDDWVKVVPSVLATPTPIPASTPPPPPRSPSRKPTSEDLLGALDKLDARVKHIAIIEDNPDAARLLRRILQTRGDYQIKEAHSGKEGLELIRTLHPDLIMLDLMMPDMDGFSVLDNLKADPELENIPVIVITAKELNTEERKRLQGQIQMLMQKGSFMQEDLVAGIHALLGEEEEQI